MAQQSAAQRWLCLWMEGTRACNGACKWTVTPIWHNFIVLVYLMELQSWWSPVNPNDEAFVPEVKIRYSACGLCWNGGSLDRLRRLLPDVSHPWLSWDVCLPSLTVELSWPRQCHAQPAYFWSHRDHWLFQKRCSEKLESSPCLGWRHPWTSSTWRATRWWWRRSCIVRHIVLHRSCRTSSSWPTSSPPIWQRSIGMGARCLPDMGRPYWCVHSLRCHPCEAGDSAQCLSGCCGHSDCASESNFCQRCDAYHNGPHRRPCDKVHRMCPFFGKTRWYNGSTARSTSRDTLSGQARCWFWCLYTSHRSSSSTWRAFASAASWHWTSNQSPTSPYWWRTWTKSRKKSSSATTSSPSTHVESSSRRSTTRNRTSKIRQFRGSPWRCIVFHGAIIDDSTPHWWDTTSGGFQELEKLFVDFFLILLVYKRDGGLASNRHFLFGWKINFTPTAVARPGWALSCSSQRIWHHVAWHHPPAFGHASASGLHTGRSSWTSDPTSPWIPSHTLWALGASGCGVTCQQRRPTYTFSQVCPLATLHHQSAIAVRNPWPWTSSAGLWGPELPMEEPRHHPEEDISPMNILDGDYIKIYVGEADVPDQCISESDMIVDDGSDLTENYDELSSLFQRSVTQSHQAFQDFGTQLGMISTKTDPTQNDQGGHLATSMPRAPAPTRITFQRGFHPDDQRRLGNLFDRDAFVECEEEGRVAYLETWYIHHDRHRHCREARAIKLHDNPQEWAEEILELWDLQEDLDEDIILHLVQPTPPCTRFQCVLGHIIVEHAPQPEKTVGILSIDATDHRGTSLEHEAHSLDDYMGRNMVLRKAELDVFCQTRICTVSLGALPFGLVDIEEVPRAVCLTIHIRPVLLYNDDTDFTDLMQRAPLTARWRRQRAPQAGNDLSSAPARCDGTAFNFNPNAPVFNPAEPFIGYMPENVQDLHQAWQRTAFSWEGESASTSVITWFVDQHNAALHHCHVPRIVRLFANFDQWETNFRQAWHDFALPGAPIMIHVVNPPPSNLDQDHAAHVIIIQNPMDQFSSSLITGFDSTAPNPGHPVFQLAMTTMEILHYDHLIMALGLGGRCLYPGSPAQCSLRYGQHEILRGVPFPARDGHGLTVRITPRPTFQTQGIPEDGPVLLQLDALIHSTRDSERLTTASVAHEQWPLPSELSTQIDSLVSDETIGIQLISGCSTLVLPAYIECASPGNAKDIQKELQSWGIECQAIRFGSHWKAFCLPWTWQSAEQAFHYVFYHQDVTDAHGTFVHTDDHELSQIEIMRVLHQLGYLRAAVLTYEERLSKLYTVEFLDVVQQPQEQFGPGKQPPSWPQRLTQPRHNVPFYYPREALSDATHLINSELSLEDFDAFFKSGFGMLCRDPAGHDFPESTKSVLHISEHQDLAEFDRIIIYADGSSQPAYRHRPPQWNEELGLGDTWAFAVLGETYVGSRTKVEIIGWVAQPVRYAEDSSSFLGSHSIGSLPAEREAMTWAALWRLSHDVNTPTLFRTDSSTTASQSTGIIGTQNLDTSFQTLRSCFQALETALGDRLVVEHVPGHCDEPYNDMVDWLAQRERQKSFYFPRQKIDLRQWRAFLPYFWMVFSTKEGLPEWHANGFHVPPPQLPEKTPDLDHDQNQLDNATLADIHISLCSANVGSMYNGDWGHVGKLDYLRTQFIALGLNFLGIQEARTPETCSKTKDVYRLAGGSDQGRGGTELWINMAQAYAYIASRPVFFAPHHFVVTHKDPQCLLVHGVTEWVDIWIAVGHAPHSGRPRQEVQAWWDHFAEVTSQCPSGARLYVLVDANAGPGSPDGRTVFEQIGQSTTCTPFLRAFLEDRALCLPCTAACHDGDYATWRTPDGLSEHIIDYVAIPGSCLHECALSRVIEEFDLGNSHHDHQAVAIQLQWQEQKVLKVTCAQPQCRFDPQQLQAHHVTAALLSHDVPPWQTDIEKQVHSFNHHLLQELARTCPMNKQKAKKPGIDPTTWSHRIQKLAARRGLKEIAGRRRRELLRICLTSWQQPSAELQHRFWQYDGWLLCLNVKLFGRFHIAAQQLRLGLKRCKTKHLQQALDNLHPEAPASAILHELKKVIGPTNLRAIKQQTLPMIQDHEGHICTTPQRTLDAWIKFFQDMEGGQRMDASQQRSLWIDNLASFQTETLHLSLAEVPSLVELEMAYRHVKPHKATGPDRIDASICAKHPASVAKKTYSQLLKLYTHGQECLLHKGGRLQPIWKQKGPRHLCSAYRSVLISSHVGKSLHRCLRLHTADVFEHYLQSQQMGGKRGIPVTLGVHQARAYMRSRSRGGRCVGLLFLDLSEAFYRVVRQLALGGPPDDQAIAAIGARLQLGPDLLHDLYLHLEDPSAVERAGLSPQLQKVLRALHTDTHFHVGLQMDRCRTTLGTRPGDCFADIVFSFLWARLLQKLEYTLCQDGLLDIVPDDTGVKIEDFGNPNAPSIATSKAYLGPTWMDDTCITFSAASPADLEIAAGRIGNELLSSCDAFAMSPNLAKGKTEMLLIFQGAGANQAKKRLFGPNSPGTFPILTEAGPRFVNLVSAYTHLGCTLHHRGDLRKEMRRRLSIAHAAFSRHRRLLYQNQGLTMIRRRELFRTLILSKLLYGAESWTLRDQRDKHFLHSALMRLYNRLLPHQARAQRSNAEILVLTGLPDPSTLLCTCRLRHLGLLYKCTDTACWGLLNSDLEWLQLIRDDLIWMHSQLENTTSLPPPSQDFGRWEYMMQFHPNYWKRLVRRSGEHDARQRHNMHIVTQFHGEVLATLHDAGKLRGEPPHDAQPPLAAVHACMQRERRFGSKGGCGAHLFKVHGRVNPVRHLFAQTHCGACMKEYHTFTKLKAHLLAAERCRHILQGRRERWLPAPGSGSSIEKALNEQHDSLLPPLQAQGPLAQTRPLRPDEDYDLAIIEELYTDFLEIDTISACEKAVRDIAKRHAVSWATFSRSLDQFLDMLTEADAQMLNVPEVELRSLLRSLQQPSKWTFLRGPQQQKSSPWHRPIAQLEQFCVSELESPGGVIPTPVHRPFGRERYILHLFAGRRRRGDFQFYVDALQHLHGGLQIYVLSVDIVIDKQWGDLSKEEVRKFWINAIHDRGVVALMGGPPCETWSRARGKPTASHLPGRRTGPRIVRTLQEVWGKSSLSLRELDQVTIGNLLMGFQLVAMAALACTGGVAILEHPAEPPEVAAASIWRTPIMQLLLQLPEFCQLSIAQGLWGAQSAKPTTLAVLNAPNLGKILHQSRVTMDLPRCTSIGRDAGGHWATSKLKEYPPGLCLALATGILEALGNCALDESIQVSPRFQEQCGQMICTQYGDAYGPDFAGWVIFPGPMCPLNWDMLRSQRDPLLCA